MAGAGRTGGWFSGKWILAVCGLLAAAVSGISRAQDADTDKSSPDWFDLAHGAFVVTASSEYEPTSWSAINLIDGMSEQGWSSAADAKLPIVFVIELARPVRLTRFQVDTRKVDMDSRAVRRISLYALEAQASGAGDRMTAAGDGARLLVSGEVPRAGVGDFAIAHPVVVRRVKLVVESNWGAPRYTEIMELAGFGAAAGDVKGRQAVPLEAAVTGVYRTNYGLMQLNQKDAQVTGCYPSYEGYLLGDTDGRVIRFAWRDGTGQGSAVMVLDAARRHLAGIWYKDGSYGGLWRGWRLDKVEEQLDCAPAGSGIEGSLAATGRATTYGIHFDTDSANLRADAVQTLNEIATSLRRHPRWRVAIIGHTDARGTAAHNLALSRARATAVVDWLVAHGIAAERLRAEGRGEDEPVADNATAQGRALNRRVEIHLQQ